MSSSDSSPSRRALEDFVAGRMPADRLVQTVAGRFYGKAGTGERKGEALRPFMEIAERSAPGVVSLERTEGGTGFDVRAVERVFPEASLDALRGAAAAALAASWTDPVMAVPAPESRAQSPEPRAQSRTPSPKSNPEPKVPNPELLRAGSAEL